MSLGGAVGLAATAIPITAAATVLNATRCVAGCGRKAKHYHGKHGCCANHSCHRKISTRHDIFGEGWAFTEGMVDAKGEW